MLAGPLRGACRSVHRTIGQFERFSQVTPRNVRTKYNSTPIRPQSRTFVLLHERPNHSRTTTYAFTRYE